MKPKFSKPSSEEDGVKKHHRTFPKKPTPIEPMSNNKFQRQAAIHKEQEQSGHFFADRRKIHFGGTPKMQYREGGKFYKPPPKSENGAKFEKSGAKKSGKKDLKKCGKKKKGEPIKGTSTEWAELGNSDEDDDVIDTSDMITEDVEDSDDVMEMDSEIPLVNTAKKTTSSKSGQAKKQKTWHPEEEDSEDDAPEDVPSKKTSTKDSDDVDDDEEEAPEDSESDDEEERLKFREEISQMPLGKVREMKEKLGIKLFNKTYFGTSEVEKKKNEEKKKVLKNDGGQHRPKEISSKRPVSSFRNIYGDHEKGIQKKRWDPRFDARAGDFKEVCFENNYQFLDDIRTGEMQDLRNEYNTARGEGDEKKAARLKNTLQKMETREKTRAEKRRQAETRKELHDDNIERMLRGEAPIFRTKAQVRRIDAEKKYEELKKDNKLDKYLQRKAKKESAKQKKARPLDGYGYQN